MDDRTRVELATSNRIWQGYGRTQPFWSVLTHPEYLDLDPQADPALADAFYATGTADIDGLVAWAAEFDRPLRGNLAVDFGCGVGRMTLPLAARYDMAIGLDISEGHLDAARARAVDRGVANVRFWAASDPLPVAPASADLVVTRLVLQHLAPAVQQFTIGTLLALLRRGGLASLHTLARRADGRTGEAAFATAVAAGKMDMLDGRGLEAYCGRMGYRILDIRTEENPNIGVYATYLIEWSA